MERLPDDFWDAPVDGRGPGAPSGAATVDARTSGSAPARSASAPTPPPRAAAPRPATQTRAEPGASGDVPPGGPGVARLQTIFNGRVIAIEPHRDETPPDEPGIAPNGPDTTEGTG